MVRTVDGIKVVPNRMLKSYLEKEVPKRAQARALRLNQKPDAIIESDDNTYIGRVAGRVDVNLPTPTPSAPNSRAEPTFRHVADLALSDAGLTVFSQGSELSPEWIRRSPENSDFRRTQAKVLNAQAPGSSTGTGINIVGVGLEFAVSNPRMKVKRLPSTDLAGSRTGRSVWPTRRQRRSRLCRRERNGGGGIDRLCGYRDCKSAARSQRELRPISQRWWIG